MAIRSRTLLCNMTQLGETCEVHHLVVYKSETLMDFYRTARLHIPEGVTLHGHHSENLRSSTQYVYEVVLLYRYECWSLSLWEKQIQDIYNEVGLFKITFVSKKEKVK
jgi:hypothetical protein